MDNVTLVRAAPNKWGVRVKVSSGKYCVKGSYTYLEAHPVVAAERTLHALMALGLREDKIPEAKEYVYSLSGDVKQRLKPAIKKFSLTTTNAIKPLTF